MQEIIQPNLAISELSNSIPSDMEIRVRDNTPTKQKSLRRFSSTQKTGEEWTLAADPTRVSLLLVVVVDVSAIVMNVAAVGTHISAIMVEVMSIVTNVAAIMPNVALVAT